MKNYRMGKGVTAVYNSFKEVAAAFGCQPYVKKTKDEKKLEKQKEQFSSKHKCKACGQPLTYIGGNQMCCQNEKCKGIKVERTDADGNKLISYFPSFELLDDKGAEIAQNIFNN